MKIDTIKAELKQLNTAVEDLQKKLSDIYGDELPQEPKKLSRGLRFKTDTDLFTAEEQELNKKLDKTIVSSMRLEKTLSEELSNITRAQHDRESYYSSLYSGADLVTLYRETDETLQKAQALSKTLSTLSRGIQNIASSRYFDRLTDRRGKGDKAGKLRAIHSEIKTIGEGADTKTTDGEPIRVGGFTVIDNRGDDFTNKLSQFFEAIQAVNLLCHYSNGYYELHYNAILPTNYKDITADRQKAFIRELIEPCFKSHLEAIRALPYPTKEAEKYINDAVEDIYSQLDIVIDAGAEEKAELLHSKRNPVNNYSYNMSALQRAIFSGEEKGQITLFSYVDEKTGKRGEVNTFFSTDYNNLEGVKLKTPFSFEDTNLYNSLDSEYKAGNNLFTTQQLYKTMLGGDSSAKLSDSKRAEITQRIETIAGRRQHVDNSEYAKRTGRRDFIRVTDNLLNIMHLEEAEIDGKVLRDVWLLKERPLLSRYGESIGQNRDIPMRLLQTGTGVAYAPLKEHLLSQVMYMRSENQKRGNRILLAPVYEKLYNGADTHQKQRLTENAETILKHWIREPYKDGKPFIHSYELEYSEGTQREIAKAESKGKSTQSVKKVAIAIKIYFEGNRLTAEASKNRLIALERGGTKKKRGRKK